jgi:hypothetical protein
MRFFIYLFDHSSNAESNCDIETNLRVYVPSCCTAKFVNLNHCNHHFFSKSQKLYANTNYSEVVVIWGNV